MENITNAKIEKLEREIVKTRARIAENSVKLREQVKLLKAYEDAEIAAQYRRRLENEDSMAKLKNAKIAKEREENIDVDFQKEETLADVTAASN